MNSLDYACNMTIMTLCVILLVRNYFVHRFLGRLVEAIKEIGIKEINEEDDFLTYKKRFRQLESVHYLELLFVFWKPFRKFYTGKDLIEPLL